MRFIFILVAFLSAGVSMAATVQNCAVSHSTGNTFSVHIDGVADISLSTICGHSARDIRNSARSLSVNVVGGIDCHTVNQFHTMDLTVTFDKQSPQVQLQALQTGIVQAFGTAGLSFDTSKCALPTDFSNDILSMAEYINFDIL